MFYLSSFNAQMVIILCFFESRVYFHNSLQFENARLLPNIKEHISTCMTKLETHVNISMLHNFSRRQKC